MRRDLATIGLLSALILRLLLAARWDPLADEAYHWVWSLHPALGYYDQPPMVAWGDALGELLLGHRPLAIRAGGVLLGTAAVLLLLPYAKDRGLLVRWLIGLPPLAFLGTLGVPDAWLLGWWGLTLALALRGGRAWVAAGVAGGLAALSKHDGVLVYPLCLAAMGADERRTRWPWLGLAALGVVVAPHVGWLATHDWVTVRFQLEEGLLSPRPPGAWGPLRVLVDQTALLGPLAAVAVPLAWWSARKGDRTDRIALATSLPVFLAFLLASVGGPPEAHWPAPAWIGAGLLLSRSGGRLWRLGALASWLGAFTALALAAHVEHPLAHLPVDPGARFGEGRALADGVAMRALPLGVAAWEPGVERVDRVLTERYQEASLVHWHLGVPARVAEGCGRRSQQDLWERPDPGPEPLFVRPSRGGPPGCVVPPYRMVEVQRLNPVDARERRVGPWDLIELRLDPP
ncbi:MAG: glycosyltransferase family 39 protein [Alphaproteobacteria bacterium]|nr:glycosyltransferase family 39 protein [Alphaproteobacteria bacterium]MCB9699507.1 glycosyltransferase family 39 protein [Alphaproteobacteria bacterium]